MSHLKLGSLLFVSLTVSAAAVVTEDGVIDPPTVHGHSRVDSRELWVSTSVPPGHQTIDAALAHQRTSRVPLGQSGTSGILPQSRLIFQPDHPSHLTGVFPASAVTSTDHVFGDVSVKRGAVVAGLRGDDGQRDGAEGGGDLPRAGAGVAPARHSAHSARCYGGGLTGQQSDGDVAVQVDGRLQLETAQGIMSLLTDPRPRPPLELYLYEHDVVVVGGGVVLRVGHQHLGQDFLFRALIDG